MGVAHPRPLRFVSIPYPPRSSRRTIRAAAFPLPPLPPPPRPRSLRLPVPPTGPEGVVLGVLAVRVRGSDPPGGFGVPWVSEPAGRLRP
ncbi:hypothetical protein KSE_01140 [Kitasatospora setae KM-6054]|uniref:Uncharacterized protein n=1 Tax=Kitasatospora setae (strain ATCC 33774 / DSM 43861 / JCM 3304 / KCC A-0304 / NBRC 14216 / KM-6054) TaxID=452652 RepID=E4N434_KITSK|nr:hypothetical protein KSE_01140 [Kitasatospora setae KM-6054]